MRFLVDTNIFLHAVNGGSAHHNRARQFFKEHVRMRTAWTTTWPIMYEFLRVATHRRVFERPLKPEQALAFVKQIAELEEVTMLSPTPRHAEVLDFVVSGIGSPTGNLFHDIHTATLMREHGVPEIVTADTDFLQFKFLKVTNPLL